MQGLLSDIGRHEHLEWMQKPTYKKLNKVAMQSPLGDTGRHKDLSQVYGPK